MSSSIQEFAEQVSFLTPLAIELEIGRLMAEGKLTPEDRLEILAHLVKMSDEERASAGIRCLGFPGVNLEEMRSMVEPRLWLAIKMGATRLATAREEQEQFFEQVAQMPGTTVSRFSG